MAIEPFLHSVPTLAEAPDRFEAALRELSAVARPPAERAIRQIRDTITRIDALADASEAFGRGRARAHSPSFSSSRSNGESECFKRWISVFCLTSTRKLFSIGYRVADGSLDPNCYDLLASEARLTSFIAIAKGEVPPSHWFRLGRALTPVGRGSALISWSGSMFEYLMPALVMRSPAGSLLSQTYELVVRRQIEYGAERGMCPGECRNRHTMRAISISPINIPALACPDWGSSAASAKISSSLRTPLRLRP